MSAIQNILIDSAERLFDSLVTPSVLEATEGGNWPSPVWDAIEEHGFASALIPESLGGYGSTWHDAYFVVRAAGRYRVPAPLPETLCARWLQAQSGLAVSSGPLTMSRPGPDVVLAKNNGQWRLSGTLPRAPWGRIAEAVVFTVESDGAVVVVSAPVAGATVLTGTNLAGEWRDSLTFTNHPVLAAAWPKDSAPADVGVLGAMSRSAQIAGGLSSLIEMAVAYANDRRQFGKPIGKFQAIQQNLAVLASEAAAADVAAEMAFRAMDGHVPGYLAAVAKIRSAEAATRAAAIAHQVHGAIGFTREYQLHWITRRLMAWRSEFGGAREWAGHLGRQVVTTGAAGFWPSLTAQ
jgi:acyl-CoA dehydrogenase